MVNKRIVEALQYIFCKLFQFVFRQVQRFHQLVKHHFMDVLSDYRMLAGIAYNIYLRQIGYWRQYGMRAIQQGYFSFVVRFFRRNKQYIQSGFVGREFFGDFLRSLDDP